jgi:gliding motility-associated-like protein
MPTFPPAKSVFWPRWLLTYLFVAMLGLLARPAYASHLRAGDIQAKVDTTAAHNPNRIFFKLTLYRDTSPNSAPQPDAILFFGDGTRSAAVLPTVDAPIGFDTNVMTFYFEHTYPGTGSYTASFIEANRSRAVVNMLASDSQTFYLSTSITVDPGLGLNHLPVLKAPAIDRAAAGQVFLHNPAAYDIDGDSLAYRRMVSQRSRTYTNPTSLPAFYIPDHVRCDGFQYPNSQAYGAGGRNPVQVSFKDNNGVELAQIGDTAIFQMNARTGQIVWNAPLRTGTYNVALIVEEWRRNGLTHLKIGEVIRDMQITVVAAVNLRPTLKIPQDTCVVAGTLLRKNVTATDGSSAASPASPIQLFAYSGIIPPATFTQSAQGPPLAVGTFTWTPSCENIAREPYNIVFKAQDTPHTPPIASDPPLIDEKTWRVTVIGSAPTNLRAVRGGSSQQVLLTWASYPCQAPNGLGVRPSIRIYRREGCYAYTPSPCETGLPASAGYRLIDTVPANLTAYADNTVQRGRTYSYRIYVVFPLPGAGASIVSNEACITLDGRAAQLTNVDVLTTSAATGQIAVKWTQPRPGTGAAFNAPLGYRLSRSSTGAAPFALVATKTNLADTTFLDTNLNTAGLQYTYQLVFFTAATTQPGSPETTETAPLASSVRLSLAPNGNSRLNTLTWRYSVPWDNSQQPTIIYRRVGAPTGPYTQLATLTPAAGATSATYVDQGLTLGQNYCYYVQTNGQYPAPVNSAGQPLYRNLLNQSQETCAVLTASPCTPVLTLAPTNCDSLAGLNPGSNFPLQDLRYQNRLRWTVGSAPTGCSTDIAYYRVFYRPTLDGPLVLLDSVTTLTYLHRNLPNGAGCYAVQAVSTAGLRSDLSNVACQDNCVFFFLPNIFTPNGDQTNEKFRPKTSSPIVRTHIQIFNRWGRKVYESDKDPYINWDGTGGENNQNGKASNGVYYYLAEVEFADFARTKRTFKGWVEIVR